MIKIQNKGVRNKEFEVYLTDKLDRVLIQLQGELLH